LHNPFKFTHRHTEATLNTYPRGDRIIIDVGDNCGGLLVGDADKMFSPVAQHSHDKTGLGLGLSLARQSVTDRGGLLTVSDVPGVGCNFSISLPRYTVN
jgi:C4-dicarboxylate-specific signal transduction histidine kinase